MLLSSEDLYSIKWHSGEEVKPSQIKSLFSYNMQSGFQTHLDMQIDGYFFLKTFLNVHTPTCGILFSGLKNVLVLSDFQDVNFLAVNGLTDNI